MSSIDFNSEAAYYHEKATRAMFKAGKENPHRRPITSREDALIAREVRLHSERIIVGYKAIEAEEESFSILCCQRCSRELQEDLSDAKLIRSVYHNRRPPQHFFICADIAICNS